MRKERKKDYIYSPFYASRQMSSEFLGSGELVHVTIPSQGKHHNPKYPSLLLLTLPFMAEYDAHSGEYLLGQFRSGVPAVSPPNLLPIYSLLAFQVVGWRDRPVAINAKHSTERAAKMKAKSIPARSNLRTKRRCAVLCVI